MVKERYFLIGYNAYIDKVDNMLGMITISSENFPSYIEIKNSIKISGDKRLTKKDSLLITSIYEFQSKEDFISFSKWEDVEEENKITFEEVEQSLSKLLISKYFYTPESLTAFFGNETIISMIESYINNSKDNVVDVEGLLQTIFDNK